MGRIVVATDGTPTAATAVRWAAEEAATRGWALHIVHVAPPVNGTAETAADERSHDDREDVLDRAAAVAQATRPCVSVTTELRTGLVADQLVDELMNADALVMGTRRNGSLARLVIASACGTVAGPGAPPVIVVRDGAAARHGEVVVGFDRSQSARLALRYAFDEADCRHARLKVVVGWTVSMTGYDFGFSDIVRGVLEEDQKEVEEEIEKWYYAYPRVPVEIIFRLQSPVVALAAASTQADLVVVGSRGLGTVGSALLGSVGNGVLRHARCPVAVVGQARHRLAQEPVETGHVIVA